MYEYKEENENEELHHGLKFQDGNQEKKIAIFLAWCIKKKKKTILK